MRSALLYLGINGHIKKRNTGRLAQQFVSLNLHHLISFLKKAVAHEYSKKIKGTFMKRLLKDFNVFNKKGWIIKIWLINIIQDSLH